MYSRGHTAMMAVWRERSKDMSLAKFSTIFRRGSKKGAQRFWLFTVYARVSRRTLLDCTHTRTYKHTVYIYPRLRFLLLPTRSFGCITADAPDPVGPLIKYVSWMKTAQGKGHKALTGSCERRAKFFFFIYKKYTRERENAYYLNIGRARKREEWGRKRNSERE